jgi:hypothetical protein
MGGAKDKIARQHLVPYAGTNRIRSAGISQHTWTQRSLHCSLERKERETTGAPRQDETPV